MSSGCFVVKLVDLWFNRVPNLGCQFCTFFEWINSLRGCYKNQDGYDHIQLGSDIQGANITLCCKFLLRLGLR